MKLSCSEEWSEARLPRLGSVDLPLYLYGLDHAQGGYSVSSLVVGSNATMRLHGVMIKSVYQNQVHRKPLMLSATVALTFY